MSDVMIKLENARQRLRDLGATGMNMSLNDEAGASMEDYASDLIVFVEFIEKRLK